MLSRAPAGSGMMSAMAEATLTDVPPGHGVISKMTSDDGDFRITWDPANPDEVENARQAFADLRRDRYTLYKIGEGRRGRREVIREFDPAEGAIQVVAVRASQGG
jgi:hypothetical protein